jgi:hypothetical protein
VHQRTGPDRRLKTVNNEYEHDELESTDKSNAEKPDEGTSTKAEFKLTVRKLELPVRPRGVLAE